MLTIDILLNNLEIKKLVVERSIKYSIPLKFLCAEAGLDYNKFMLSYINAKNPSGVSEEQFLKILECLGIELKLNLIINSSIDMSLKSRQLEEKYQGLLGRKK